MASEIDSEFNTKTGEYGAFKKSKYCRTQKAFITFKMLASARCYRVSKGIGQTVNYGILRLADRVNVYHFGATQLYKIQGQINDQTALIQKAKEHAETLYMY